MHFSHLYASIHARKMYFTFRQRLLLYYNTFLRLSTEIHMKYLPLPVFSLLLPGLLDVRASRTYVCIFMRIFFNINSLSFYLLYIVHIFYYFMYIYTFINSDFFFHSCIFLSFYYKSRRISGDENPPVYTFFIFCSLHFVAQPFRSCETAPYTPRHPLTPLPWQATGCTSPHDRCGRVLRS